MFGRTSTKKLIREVQGLLDRARALPLDSQERANLLAEAAIVQGQVLARTARATELNSLLAAVTNGK